ncbi:unnamed protein product [Peniophora sp. CBMAI 1063]|nr:unnamed protein product [Peniophora sp. CBMAI 1063]
MHPHRNSTGGRPPRHLMTARKSTGGMAPRLQLAHRPLTGMTARKSATVAGVHPRKLSDIVKSEQRDDREYLNRMGSLDDVTKLVMNTLAMKAEMESSPKVQ